MDDQIQRFGETIICAPLLNVLERRFAELMVNAQWCMIDGRNVERNGEVILEARLFVGRGKVVRFEGCSLSKRS